MVASEESTSAMDNKTPDVTPGSYSPVSVSMDGNTLGAIFLGILSIALLIGWIRSEERYHALVIRQEMSDGNRLSNTR